MLTIALDGMSFFAHHGYYPQERIWGNTFILDIVLKMDPPTHMEDLSSTVNYEEVYQIASETMAQPTALLETVVATISNKIKERFPFIQYSAVTLRKQAPPLRGDVMQSRVCLEKHY